MTIFKNIILTISISAMLLSCGEKTDNNETPKQETPQALQNNELELEIKSNGRSGNLIEELYQELIDKTPGLKKLEDDIDALQPKPNELKDKFNTYNNKSQNYYSSSNYKAATISDNLLKNKIIALIAASNKKYTNKTAEINSLLSQISKNGATLNDHHSVLKIVLTLPIIEKYQDDNKPNKKEFQDLINEQGKLILQTDSLTPTY